MNVCVCVCVCGLSHPASKAHAPCYIVIFDLSGCTTFPTSSQKRTRFSKKTLLNIKRVFRFPLQRLPQTFLILKITRRDIIINVRKPSCTVPVILFLDVNGT
jgi:hypothetical protein